MWDKTFFYSFLLLPSVYSFECSYKKRVHRLQCGKLECAAFTSPFKPQSLPEGSYLIADSHQRHSFRFSLFKKIEDERIYGEGFWSSNAYQPEYECKKIDFCMKSGSILKDCLSVGNRTCFDILERKIVTENHLTATKTCTEDQCVSNNCRVQRNPLLNNETFYVRLTVTD